MQRRTWKRAAAWAGILALALHALAPLAAPAAPAAEAGLHDLCGQAPSTPAPGGHPQGDHCSLCAQPAAIASQPVFPEIFSSRSPDQPASESSQYSQPLYLAALSRAPPAGA